MNNLREYTIIPGPKHFHVNKGDRHAATNLFAEIINEKSRSGWTYHSMETLTVTEKPGCLQQPTTIQHYKRQVSL
jgi:hypothetical protein